MIDRTPWIVDCDLYNTFGKGVEPTWEAMLAQKDHFTECNRFHNERFHHCYAAIAEGADARGIEHIPEVFLEYLACAAKKMPDDAEVILASTIGLIDQLDNPENRCTSDLLLERALKILNKKTGRVISAACASVNTSFASLNHLIRRGNLDSAIVIGTDYVSEFIYSGFSTLRALASGTVHPYDKTRDGLQLGDSGALVSVCAAYKARELGLKPRAAIAGAGCSCDAYHITAPNPNGDGLIQAIQAALHSAGLTPQDIGAVIGHGTGTLYNDSMELKALHHFFGTQGIPLLSVKGNTGHTLAGAGLMQMLVALKMIETGMIPPQNGIVSPEPEAEHYVSTEVRRLSIPRVLCMNSGFGGLNAAVIVEGVQG